MRINPIDRRPVYAQVADYLRDQILSGAYRPDDRLPFEHELMETYGVGREPVRQAMAILRGEGLIHTMAGRGSRVRHAPVRTRITLAPGAVVTARMPLGHEHHTYRVTEGIPLLEVRDPDGSVDVYAADRVELVAAPDLPAATPD